MNIFSMAGLEFILRWSHFLSGITWIGLLYYFNFVQGPFLASATPETKKEVTQKLLPRALWWFRWGALFTIIFGWSIYLMKWHLMGAYFFSSSYGVSITIGGLLGTIMWYNVWFIIWPNQKVIIAIAHGEKLELGNRPRVAFLASRVNTALSIPMLFFMAAASHINWG